MTAEAVKVAYVCDGGACNGGCTSEECSHTTDIEHAKNFIRLEDAYLEDAYMVRTEAEPKTGWIPCSERLPDIGDTFLVTVMVGTEIKTDVASNFGSYIDGFWDTFNDWIEDEECHVIAWMPLPEPYREDGEA